MANQEVKTDVKLTGNRDANVRVIVEKAKNAQWAYNNLGELITQLDAIPEPQRIKKYGLSNKEVTAFKEIRLGVIDHIQKTDPKGIGADKLYYGNNKAALAKVDAEFKKTRSADNARLGEINTRTPIQKGIKFAEGFGQGLTLDQRAATFEKMGLTGNQALSNLDPDDPFLSSGVRTGYSFGNEYTRSAAGIPFTLGGGSAAAGAIGLLGKALPQTRAVQGFVGLAQGLGSMYAGAKAGELGSGLVDRFDPFNKLSPDTQSLITRTVAGPEKGIGSAAAQMSLFSPFSRNSAGQLSLIEGDGLIGSAKKLFKQGPAALGSSALETPLDIGGRIGDALGANDAAEANNKGIESRLLSTLGRTPTREELIAEGWMTPEERQIQVGLSLGLGGFTKHGEIFTGKHPFNAARQGLDRLQDAVVNRGRAAQATAPTIPTPSLQIPTLPSVPKIDTGGMFKFNVNIPGLNQQPASQARISFDPSPTRKTATVEPRVDRIPDQWRIPLTKALREKVGLVNGTLITGVSQDGDFFTQTQQLDGTYKVETRSYQELPDALKQRVKETLYQTKVDGKAIDADATFNPSNGYKSEYNTNLDQSSFYKDQYPARVEINGREVNAAVVEKVGASNVRVQLPSGNSLVLPTSMVQGDVNVTGVRAAKSPRLSSIKDANGNLIAYEEQGIDFFVPRGPSNAIRDAAAATPGSWKDLFKMDPGTWQSLSNDQMQPGTVIELENVGKGKDLWGVVLRAEQFSFDGDDAYGWRVQPLHDPRAAQVIVEHTGVNAVNINDPAIVQDAVESGALDPSVASEIQSDGSIQPTEEVSGTPVDVVQAPESATGTGTSNVSPAVVQTTTSGNATTTNPVDANPESNPFAVTSGAPPSSESTRPQPASTVAPVAPVATPAPTALPQTTAQPVAQPAATAVDKTESQPATPSAAQVKPNESASAATGSEPPKGVMGSNSSARTQPEDYKFPFNEEFKKVIRDEDLPPEMQSSNRKTSDGTEVNAYRGMTKGEEVRLTGNVGTIIPFPGMSDSAPLTRLTAAFKLNVKAGSKTESWDIQVKGASDDGKFGKAEFKQLLVSEWGQTEKQAEALSKYVDRWAVGWAKEIARLSGYNVNTVARALRIDKDPKASNELENWETWKSSYREQQVLNPTEANKKLIAKLVGVFYAQRLGGIAGLTPEQRVTLGRPGATFTLQGNNNQVLHVALAMRGKLNYVTQVHEVNHLLVRSLYGPMYHEMAAAIRRSFEITGKQEANTRVITSDVEEQMVVALTNAMFHSTDAKKVIRERFKEGGAFNDSTLTQMFNEIGKQMRDSVVSGQTEEYNDLSTNKAWGVRFNPKEKYATNTPVLYSISADRKLPGVTTADYNPETGDQTVKVKYFMDGTEFVESINPGQLQIGEAEVTKLNDAAQAIVAKWLGHWYDWTSDQVGQYAPTIENKNFVPTTIQEVVRKNVGYNWWTNVEDFRNRSTAADAGSKTTFSDKRIRARSRYSYLGWLDNPDGPGYNSYMSFADLLTQETESYNSSVKTLTMNAAGESGLISQALAKQIENEKKSLETSVNDLKTEAPASTPQPTPSVTPVFDIAKWNADQLTEIEKSISNISLLLSEGKVDEAKAAAALAVNKYSARIKREIDKGSLTSADAKSVVDSYEKISDLITTGVTKSVDEIKTEQEEATKDLSETTADQLQSIVNIDFSAQNLDGDDIDIFGGGSGMSTLIAKVDNPNKKDWLTDATEDFNSSLKTIFNTTTVRGIDKNTKVPDPNKYSANIEKLIDSMAQSDMAYVFANAQIRRQALYFDELIGLYVTSPKKQQILGNNHQNVMRAIVDTNIRTRLSSIMRTVYTDNGKLYMSVESDGYVHPIEINATRLFKEFQRAISTGAQTAVREYVQTELNRVEGSQDVLTRYLKRTRGNFDHAVRLVVSTRAYSNWQRRKPENRDWIDVKSLTTSNSGLSTEVISAFKSVKNSNDVKSVMDLYSDELANNPLFAHHIEKLNNPKIGDTQISGTTIPNIVFSEKQVQDVEKIFRDIEESKKLVVSLDQPDFVEPAAKASGSFEKLMSKQAEGDSADSLSQDERAVMEVAKSFLTSPDYFVNLVDDFIESAEKTQNLSYSYGKLKSMLDDQQKIITLKKENLAFEKTQQDNERAINKAIEEIQLAQQGEAKIIGEIKKRKNKAEEICRKNIASMNTMFDILADVDDKDIYRFFVPATQEDAQKIHWLAQTNPSGIPNLYTALEDNANDLESSNLDLITALKEYIDNNDEDLNFEDYRSLATSLSNIEKMFDRAMNTYDRSREIQTRGNLTPRFVQFANTVSVKDAVILDARRVNMQTFRIGSKSAFSSEEIQSFIGLGSSTYKDALLNSAEEQKKNNEIREKLKKELGQTPSTDQLVAAGYKESLIEKMNRVETFSLLGKNNPHMDAATIDRHRGMFREIFAYLKKEQVFGKGESAKKMTMETKLFTRPESFTIGEKIWMTLDLVESNAYSIKEDKNITELRDILRRNLQVKEGTAKQRLVAQSKNLRLFRKSLADSMIMPIQRDYVGTRPGGLVEVTTTSPDDVTKFAESVFRHVLKGDEVSILNASEFTRRGFYQSLIRRINKAMVGSKAAKADIGSARTVLSDAELFAIAEVYDVPGHEYTIDEKYAFVNEMIKKRDEAIRKPLDEWIKDRQITRSEMTVESLNAYLNESQMSEVDKQAFIGLFVNSLAASKSQLKRYVTLTGHLPERSELPAVAKIIDVSLSQLTSEYESVEKLVASVGLDAMTNNIVGTSVKITHYNRSIESISTNGVFVNLNPSELQGQNAFARSTWLDLESLIGDDAPRQFDAMYSQGGVYKTYEKERFVDKSTRKQGILATTLTDMVWGGWTGSRNNQGVGAPARLVSSKMPAPNKRVEGVNSELASKMDPERRLAVHIHNLSTKALSTVLSDVLQDRSLGDINESLRKFTRTSFVKMYAAPSKSLPDRKNSFKEFSNEFARNVLAAREEMLKSVNDPTFDSYDYTVSKNAQGQLDYSSVTVYDRMLGTNVYEIDYINGRVFAINNGVKNRIMPVPVNEYGVTWLHVKMADAILQGVTPEQRAARQPELYSAMVNTPLLNPVPAVFWHGRNRILQPSDATIFEPMFMSTVKVDAMDVYNSVGSFDPDTEDMYIKPVLDAWTIPDVTGNTRVRVDTTGLPFFDGYGYTVTTPEGHRSGVFANLIANGLSKEKALSIYAMTEHPSFKSWQDGELVENIGLRKATSFMDQGRVVDAPTYNKLNKVIALHEFVRAVQDYMDSPTPEKLDRIEFTYDETELGRHLTEAQLKSKAKAIVASEVDSLAYIKTATDLAASMTTDDIAFHVNPYLSNRDGQKTIKTGQAFTSLVFEETSNTFMNMDAPGLRTFDLGSGLTGNPSRINQPYFARSSNPLVHDAMENGIEPSAMEALMKKAISNGHDGLLVTNLRPNLLSSERKNMLYTFDDANIKPIDEMGTSTFTETDYATEDIVTPMFMSAMYAPVTTKVIPVASSATFIQPPKTAKEVAGDVVGYAGDVVQGITRFPLSLDFAFVGIQGAKAMLGLVTGRPYDTWIALRAFGASMQGMMPNTSVTVFGKKIGFDKLGRRAWLKVYEEMRKDPYFELMRDLNVPLHFVNFEKNIESKRRQIFQESGGKVRYEDIKLDMLDFDERGNMTDYFERVTPTTWIPLTGMFERQMSLNHDLLLFNQIKYQLQHNPMFKGLPNDQLAKRRDVKALVNFLAMSVGDVQYSTNDKIDAAAGRWGKFVAAAPRWYLSNVLMNPIVNPAVTALYKAVPGVRKVLGENYRGVGLYDYNLLENRALLTYQIKTFVGTAAFTALMPLMAELLGRLMGREDITGEQGIGKYRYGNWKWADSSGVWDMWNTLLTTADRATQGTFTPLPKPGDKKSTADWLQQVSTPTLYKVSPVITKLIQTVSGIDVIGRPVYATDHEWVKWYEGYFSPLVKKATGVDLGMKPMVRSLYTTSLSPTSWTAMYKTYYESDWKTQGSMPEYAADQSIKQFVAAALGTRADYDQFVPQALQGKYRLMQKYKRFYNTGPSMIEIFNDPDLHLAPRMITGEDKF